MELLVIILCVPLVILIVVKIYEAEKAVKNVSTTTRNIWKSSSEEKSPVRPSTAVVSDDDEWIEVFAPLTRSEARQKFRELKSVGIFLPDKAYVYVIKKINGEMYFTDEEYRARTSAGLPTAFVREENVFFEKAVAIVLSDLPMSEKNEALNTLYKGSKQKKRAETYMEIYRLTVKELLKSEAVKTEHKNFLRSEQRRLSFAVTKRKIFWKRIPLENLDKISRGEDPSEELVTR